MGNVVLLPQNQGSSYVLHIRFLHFCLHSETMLASRLILLDRIYLSWFTWKQGIPAESVSASCFCPHVRAHLLIVGLSPQLLQIKRIISSKEEESRTAAHFDRVCGSEWQKRSVSPQRSLLFYSFRLWKEAGGGWKIAELSEVRKRDSYFGGRYILKNVFEVL